MLKKLVQQRAKASRETILFVVVLEEEVADSAANRIAHQSFVH
jgi:hypothetical protein